MTVNGADVLARLVYENAENEWYVNPQLTGRSITEDGQEWFEVRDDDGRTGWWGLERDGFEDADTSTLVQRADSE